jgi:hypothetical protein
MREASPARRACSVPMPAPIGLRRPRRGLILGLIGASAASLLSPLPASGLGAANARESVGAAERMPALESDASAQPDASTFPLAAPLTWFSSLNIGTNWSTATSSDRGWRLQAVRGVAPARFEIAPSPGGQAGLVPFRDGAPGIAPRSGSSQSVPGVLRIDVESSAGALVHELDESALRLSRLGWQWRADGFPRGVAGVRERDDFAARVYLMFDYPLDRVPLAQRLLIRAARALHDPQLPAATLVYLLSSGPEVEVPIESPYTSRVKMIVARAQAREGLWYQESRDVLEDFQRAFGREYGPGRPPLRAIAIGADGDQTSARFTSWFGDLNADR